jgi:hypothetical protein
LVKVIMQRVRSTSASRQDAVCRQSPCPAETCRQRQGRVVDFACPDDFVHRGTTQQRNTHIRDEIRYSWHAWHGRAVWVHASLVRRGRAVAYCSLEDEKSRVLEVPLWMLDVAACSKTQVSKLGFVSTDSLRELKEILESARLRAAQAPTTPETQHQYLQDAKGAEGSTADPTETEPTSVICSSPVQSALGRPVARHSTEDHVVAGAVTQAASNNSGRTRNRRRGVR